MALILFTFFRFRWDYLDKFELRSGNAFSAFRRFQAEGVSAEYLKSVFPAESFPTWQTINTGRYPDQHGIIGKVFYDPTDELYRRARQREQHGNSFNSGYNAQTETTFFNHEDARATKAHKWWNNEKAEPVWATAAKHGVKFSAKLWSRCDVPWYDEKMVKLDGKYCSNVYAKDHSKTLSLQIGMALIDFQLNDRDASIVYDDSLGRAAEDFGPLSKKTEEALRDLDRAIEELLKNLADTSMDEHVNVIIMGDHGMTYGAPPMREYHPRGFRLPRRVQRVSLAQALRQVPDYLRMIVGSGAYAMVYPSQERHRLNLVETLKRNLAAYGDNIKVYTAEQIPEELHWKNNVTTPPILVMARPGVVLLESGVFQRPKSTFQESLKGLGGYDPNEPDMRAVFMARGPGFKQGGAVTPHIELVDVYQIFCKLLGFEPRENDGIWERIKALLRNSASVGRASAATTLIAAFAVSAFFGRSS